MGAPSPYRPKSSSPSAPSRTICRTAGAANRYAWAAGTRGRGYAWAAAGPVPAGRRSRRYAWRLVRHGRCRERTGVLRRLAYINDCAVRSRALSQTTSHTRVTRLGESRHLLKPGQLPAQFPEPRPSAAAIGVLATVVATTPAAMARADGHRPPSCSEHVTSSFRCDPKTTPGERQASVAIQSKESDEARSPARKVGSVLNAYPNGRCAPGR